MGKELWQPQPQGAPAPPNTLRPPRPPPTFHEDSEDVPEDGEGGAEDKDREEEGANGVCDLALGLQKAGGCVRQGGQSRAGHPAVPEPQCPTFPRAAERSPAPAP